jgi:hypothetical protein
MGTYTALKSHVLLDIHLGTECITVRARNSFTANEYGLPLESEYWINNFVYAKADWASVELDCSISSDPTQVQALGTRRTFVPYLVGYDD